MPKQTKSNTVPVSPRALIQRINRKLVTKGRQLKKCRSPRWRGEIGEYFVINVEHNCIVDKHVDLTELGDELGVLGAFERLADEDD